MKKPKITFLGKTKDELSPKAKQSTTTLSFIHNDEELDKFMSDNQIERTEDLFNEPVHSDDDYVDTELLSAGYNKFIEMAENDPDLSELKKVVDKAMMQIVGQTLLSLNEEEQDRLADQMADKLLDMLGE